MKILYLKIFFEGYKIHLLLNYYQYKCHKLLFSILFALKFITTDYYDLNFELRESCENWILGDQQHTRSIDDGKQNFGKEYC